MEQRRKPVRIHFSSPQEAINMYYKLELKYFLLRLIYQSQTRKVE